MDTGKEILLIRGLFMKNNELIFIGGIKSNLWLNNGKFLSRNYKQGYRVYSIDGISQAILSNGGGFGGNGGLIADMRFIEDGRFQDNK